MRRTVLSWFLVIGFLSVFLLPSTGLTQEKTKIGIVIQVDIKPFFDAIAGAKATLAEKGYGPDKVEYVEFHAMNKPETIKDAVEQFKNQGVKLILCTGTNATLEVLKATTAIPVVFTAVAYAEAIHEGAKRLGTGDNYTGTILNAPSAQVIDLGLKIKRFKKAGMVYNALEDNAVKEKDNYEKGCRNLEVEFVGIPYQGEPELMAAFSKLFAEGIDCLLIPKDTLQPKHAADIQPLIIEHKILALGSDGPHVETGIAVLAYTAPPYKVGQLAGEKIFQILAEGRKVQSVPPEGLKTFEIWLNTKLARETGVSLPVTVLKLAARVFPEKEQSQ